MQFGEPAYMAKEITSFFKKNAIFVTPRSKHGFKKDTAGQWVPSPDYLAEFKRQPSRYWFFPIDETFRALEYRFYIDLAVKDTDGVYKSRRRLTALVLRDGVPAAAGITVRWERRSGSPALRFLSGTAEAEQATTVTDANGMAEVVVLHPCAKVESSDRRLRIAAVTDADEDVLELVISRNDDVKQLKQVYANAQTEGHADALLVAQPTEEAVESSAVEELIHVLNQVVPRKKSISHYKFVPQSRCYKKDAQKAVKQYLEQFKNITKSADIPYDLSDIGIYPSLANYINVEYGPFVYQSSLGAVVDRRLLIGKTLDLTPAKISGLFGLKRGVVDLMIAEMRKRAGTYLGCDVFWLHREVHPVHKKSTNIGAVVIKDDNVKLRDSSGAEAVPLTILPKNQRYGGSLSPPQPLAGAQLVRIRLDLLREGYVRAGEVKLLRNDRETPANAGTFGSWGVPYSYGIKHTPEAFRELIEANVPGPADIVNWEEYQEGHRFGLQKDVDFDSVSNANGLKYWTGIDCSGFCHHCFTAGKYPKTDLPIVARNILAPLDKHGRGGDLYRSADSTTTFARKMDKISNAADKENFWLCGGDIIHSAGHIVIVDGDADFRPSTACDKLLVVNAYGGNAPATAKSSLFAHKTIRMPLSWWEKAASVANTSAALKLGRVYIWR